MYGHLRITGKPEGEWFRVTKNSLRWFTALFMVPVLVEIADLNLRRHLRRRQHSGHFRSSLGSLHRADREDLRHPGSARDVLLADFASQFSLLKYGLAAVLIFVGAKMLLLDVYKIPISWSLMVVAVLIVSSVLASLWVTRNRSLDGKVHDAL